MIEVLMASLTQDDCDIYLTLLQHLSRNTPETMTNYIKLLQEPKEPTNPLQNTVKREKRLHCKPSPQDSACSSLSRFRLFRELRCGPNPNIRLIALGVKKSKYPPPPRQKKKQQVQSNTEVNMKPKTGTEAMLDI